MLAAQTMVLGLVYDAAALASRRATDRKADRTWSRGKAGAGEALASD